MWESERFCVREKEKDTTWSNKALGQFWEMNLFAKMPAEKNDSLRCQFNVPQKEWMKKIVEWWHKTTINHDDNFLRQKFSEKISTVTHARGLGLNSQSFLSKFFAMPTFYGSCFFKFYAINNIIFILWPKYN